MTATPLSTELQEHGWPPTKNRADDRIDRPPFHGKMFLSHREPTDLLLHGRLMVRVYLLGLPGELGGGSTESWHAVRLWRAMQCQVTVIPTWTCDTAWRRRLESIGAGVLTVERPDDLRTLDCLRGAVVIGICSGEFLRYAPWLREAGAKLVWIGCMNFVWGNEKSFFHQFGPYDAYVYQSLFQFAVVTRELKSIGVPEDRFFRIPGSFWFDDFDFKPRDHVAGQPFVVGRLARPDPDKWHVDTWQTYAQIPYRPIEAAVMGWTESIERKLGQPPAWATTLMPCQELTAAFLRRLHCFLPLNGPVSENWPQAGLEAMAAGVPIVTQDAGGWPEQVVHGETGYLSESPVELAGYAGTLANDETLRLKMIHRARDRLCDELASPAALMKAWSELFTSLGV
jgi:glycosyltransferase involved in cell wall biosynthesis